MALELSINTVTNSIAALSITGVTIRDVDEMPESVNARECPILYPEPDRFVRNMTVEPAAFGSGTGILVDAEYDLVYTFLYKKVGAGRGLYSLYPSMLTLTQLIVNKIIVSDIITGCTELTFAGFENFGHLIDPSSQWFLGTQIILHVKELY